MISQCSLIVANDEKWILHKVCFQSNTQSQTKFLEAVNPVKEQKGNKYFEI